MIFTVVTQKKNNITDYEVFQDNDKSNTIMLDIPHWYDLPDNLHVNKDIMPLTQNWRKLQNYLNMLKFWNSVLPENVLLNMVYIWMDMVKDY